MISTAGLRAVGRGALPLLLYSSCIVSPSLPSSFVVVVLHRTAAAADVYRGCVR